MDKDEKIDSSEESELTEEELQEFMASYKGSWPIFTKWPALRKHSWPDRKCPI